MIAGPARGNRRLNSIHVAERMRLEKGMVVSDSTSSRRDSVTCDDSSSWLELKKASCSSSSRSMSYASPIF